MNCQAVITNHTLKLQTGANPTQMQMVRDILWPDTDDFLLSVNRIIMT